MKVNSVNTLLVIYFTLPHLIYTKKSLDELELVDGSTLEILGGVKNMPLIGKKFLMMKMDDRWTKNGYEIEMKWD